MKTQNMVILSTEESERLTRSMIKFDRGELSMDDSIELIQKIIDIGMIAYLSKKWKDIARMYLEMGLVELEKEEGLKS